MDRNIKGFLAVARAGNLTKASEAICVTQPALTKTIRRLEDSLGSRLFERGPNGMRLTESGRLFMLRAEKIEMNYMQAREEIDALGARHVPDFRIFAGNAFHFIAAPNLVRSLIAEFPRTRFKLGLDHGDEAVPSLLAGEIDLILGALFGAAPDGVRRRRLLKFEITPFCCRTHPLAKARVLKPSALADARWLIYSNDKLTRQHIQDYMRDNGLKPPDIALEFNSLYSGFSVVRGSKLLLPAPAVIADMARQAGLVPLRMSVPISQTKSGVWYRESSAGLPIIKRALELLSDPKIFRITDDMASAESP